MGKFIYYIFSAAFLGLAFTQYSRTDAWFWVLAYVFPAVCSVLAALSKLNYVLVALGFIGYLFLLTQNFPEVGKFNFSHPDGKDAFGLILCGNYVAVLGLIKLYRESYL
ncbi:MAG: hypothetical protein KDC92_06675 [Bacteroidetes bacterium]|nr:hypothetical protein [Bacteroidota bacterium]